MSWLFLFLLLSRFFFSLVFRSLIMMYLVWVSLGLSCLAFTVLVCTSIDSCFLSNLGSLQPSYRVLSHPHLLDPLYGALMAPHHSPARIEIKPPPRPYPHPTTPTFADRWGWCLVGVKQLLSDSFLACWADPSPVLWVEPAGFYEGFIFSCLSIGVSGLLASLAPSLRYMRQTNRQDR